MNSAPNDPPPVICSGPHRWPRGQPRPPVDPPAEAAATSPDSPEQRGSIETISNSGLDRWIRLERHAMTTSPARLRRSRSRLPNSRDRK
jgi:hypothetical protein